MNPQPILTTPRLLIRPYRLADKAELIELIGDPLVSKPLLVVPYPYTEKDADVWLSSRDAAFETGESASFAVTSKSTNELLGGCGLTFSMKFNRAELGYWVGRKFWGQGYTTEAAAAVIDWSFSEMGLNRIYAQHKSENTTSGRVMQKLGMQFEGILRQHTKKDGIYSDMVYYGILRNEWLNRQPVSIK